MDDQEKYRAKIEARMKYFNASIEEITTKTKLRKRHNRILKSSIL